MFRDLIARLSGSTALTTIRTAVTQAFDIGRTGRRLAAIPSVSTALNSLIMQYGRTAVARSRYLVLNNGYAASAKETFVQALTGFGIKPSMLGGTPDVRKTVQEDWLDWTKYSDADGLTDFYGQQALAAGELFEAGEVFGIMLETPTSEGLVPLKVRLIPAEMLPYEQINTSSVAPGNYMQLGIEFDKAGNRIAYHFLNQHPGDITKFDASWGTTRVPAENVTHVFRPVRAGQIRGIPHTLAALTTLAMLDLYDDAELERKRVAALFAAFVTKKAPADADPMGMTVPTGPSSATSGLDNAFTMSPGAVVDLLEGEDVKFSTPADVGNSFEPFQYRTLLRAAAGFGVPYFYMTGDLSKGNNGAIRAGLLAFRRRIESMQFAGIIHQLCRPVRLRWLELYTRFGLAPWTAAEYLSNKRVYQRVKWLPPKWDWVDPLKDLQAEKLAVDNGFKARHDTIEESGYDPEETDQRIEDSQTSAADHELELNTGAVPPAQTEHADPAAGDTLGDPQENPDNA